MAETYESRKASVSRMLSPGGEIPFRSLNSWGQEEDPEGMQAQISRGRATHSLAAARMPLDHLQGLQFMDTTKQADAIGGNAGAYYRRGLDPRGRGMVMNLASGNNADPRLRAYGQRTVVHELGHHVQNMTHGSLSMLGHSEGLAENYADKYSPPGTEKYPAMSAYDEDSRRAAKYLRTSQDPQGDFNRRLYTKVRQRGTLPESPEAAW